MRFPLTILYLVLNVYVSLLDKFVGSLAKSIRGGIFDLTYQVWYVPNTHEPCLCFTLRTTSADSEGGGSLTPSKATPMSLPLSVKLIDAVWLAESIARRQPTTSPTLSSGEHIRYTVYIGKT